MILTSGAGGVGAGAESGRGLRAPATESGRGLRVGLTIPPADAAGCGAGDAESVEAEGLGAAIEGDGEGLGAGEPRAEEEDFLAGVAGWGGERRIACTCSVGTLNLMILDFFRGGWPSELAELWLRSRGRLTVCLGGPMDEVELENTLMDGNVTFSTGSTFTVGAGRARG